MTCFTACHRLPLLSQTLILLCHLSEDKSTSLLQETHQTVSKCLYCIEGYLREVLQTPSITQSGQTTPLHKDRVPAALFLTLECTSCILKHATSASQDTASQDNAEPSSATAMMVHHLKHLADDLDSVREYWAHNMFSQQRFHVSARQHAMRQLALCIGQAVKVSADFMLVILTEHPMLRM